VRKIPPSKLENGRIKTGPLASTSADSMMGAFFVTGPYGYRLKIISSGVDPEFNWEHVSVSLQHRTPHWSEMCFVKDLFWNDDECAMQLHPPKSDYVNCHPFTLHLWRPMQADIPTPPLELV
jgi:hypothetical protein